jgi:glycosyltransferase involved in cell wall biosynthesis
MFNNKEKKICFIQYLENLEANIEHLSKSISENGYDVTVLTISNTDQETFEVLDERKFYRIPLKGSRNKKINILLFIAKTVKYLKNNDFAIVHIGHSPRYFSLIKILSLCDAKFIYHLLSYPISLSRLKTIKQMLIIFIQCLLMDRIIVQSDELKKKMIGIRSLKKTYVIPVGFNKRYIYPIDKTKAHNLRRLLKIKEDQPLLVYCGVIAKSRQLNLLLEAFRKVYEIIKGAKLLIIGDGDALEELKRFAITIGVTNNTIFTGRVPHHEVVNYIGIGDIGISFIPINENYNYNPPLKTYEYLGCGLPTIATSTESNRRIIKDGYNGILVDDTPAEIANAAVDLLNNETKRFMLASNARKSVLNNDFKHITKTALIPFYKGLLKDRI